MTAGVGSVEGTSMPPKLDAAGETERLQLMAPKALLMRVNAWRRRQEDLPNLSEAVRRLVEAGLETEERRRPEGER